MFVYQIYSTVLSGEYSQYTTVQNVAIASSYESHRL